MSTMSTMEISKDLKTELKTELKQVLVVLANSPDYYYLNLNYTQLEKNSKSTDPNIKCVSPDPWMGGTFRMDDGAKGMVILGMHLDILYFNPEGTDDENTECVHCYFGDKAQCIITNNMKKCLFSKKRNMLGWVLSKGKQI